MLAEAALHAGQLAAAGRCAADALATARTAGNGWNEGYALGTQATLAAAHGKLREAGQLGEAALAVMRGIDQQWGVARTLLGLGALARLRRDPAGAIECYREALPILREIDSRPDIARTLAGIGRVALDQGDLEVAREHLTESLRLSWHTGARIGVARGLEAVATLTAREGDPGLAVQLTAAAAALRAEAGLPALSAERTQQQLDPARSLGPDVLIRQWQRGLGLTADAAVALVLRPRRSGAPADGAGRAGRQSAQPGTAVLTDPTGAGNNRAYRPGLQQPGHRRGTGDQPSYRGPACCEYPGQAGLHLAGPDSCLGGGERFVTEHASGPRTGQLHPVMPLRWTLAGRHWPHA